MIFHLSVDPQRRNVGKTATTNRERKTGTSRATGKQNTASYPDAPFPSLVKHLSTLAQETAGRSQTTNTKCFDSSLTNSGPSKTWKVRVVMRESCMEVSFRGGAPPSEPRGSRPRWNPNGRRRLGWLLYEGSDKRARTIVAAPSHGRPYYARVPRLLMRCTLEGSEEG